MNPDEMYTPITSEIRWAFTAQDRLGAFPGFKFDRWLRAHDAEVAAKALRDTADWGDETQDHYYWGYNSTSETLRARADEIAPPRTSRPSS